VCVQGNDDDDSGGSDDNVGLRVTAIVLVGIVVLAIIIGAFCIIRKGRKGGLGPAMSAKTVELHHAPEDMEYVEAQDYGYSYN